MAYPRSLNLSKGILDKYCEWDSGQFLMKQKHFHEGKATKSKGCTGLDRSTEDYIHTAVPSTTATVNALNLYVCEREL